VICPCCKNQGVAFEFELYDDRYGYPGHFAHYKCPSCAHRLNQPFLNEHELSNLYTQYYPRKSYVSVPQEFGSSKRANLKNRIRQFLKPKANAFEHVPRFKRVLDIGCGTCESLEYLKNKDCEAVGVDASGRRWAAVGILCKSRAAALSETRACGS
jgi:SAM-dependent methyltransferase